MRKNFKILKIGALFLTGATVYCSIELLWRGRTHYTMGILGGLVFVILCGIENKSSSMPLLCKGIIGAGVVTLLELLVGIHLNMQLGLAIWDYSSSAYNILGQICPLYSVFWFFLCTAAFLIIKAAKKLRTRKLYTV